jgi:hypothetical protein
MGENFFEESSRIQLTELIREVLEPLAKEKSWKVAFKVHPIQDAVYVTWENNADFLTTIPYSELQNGITKEVIAKLHSANQYYAGRSKPE